MNQEKTLVLRKKYAALFCNLLSVSGTRHLFCFWFFLLRISSPGNEPLDIIMDCARAK